VKVLFLGDTHAVPQAAQLAIKKASHQGCDIVVQLGDFAYTGEHYTLFIKKTQAALERADLTLWWIDGNHDCQDTLDETPVNNDLLSSQYPYGLRSQTSRIHNIPRGHRWEWDGVTFLACGGAYSIDKAYRYPYESWWPQETITDADVERCIAGGPADVMLTHDVPWGVQHPYGPRTGGGNKDMWPASAENRKRLRIIVDAVRPNYLYHGHCHHRNSEALLLDGGHVVEIEGLDRDGASDDRNILVVDFPR
jgi:predicted phosphodiesterase